MPNKEIITLGINDLHTNLPTKGNYRGDRTLVRAKHDQQSRTGTISILNENHHTAKLFKYNNQYYQLSKGVAMGSPLSGTLAELFLQYLEKS